MVASPFSPLESLPLPRTRLIGRETERATGCTLLLDEAVPLLTLTGPGGQGKTRLALALAQEVGERFADGVIWVDLTAIRDASLVLGAVASASSVSPSSEPSMVERLIRQLRSRQCLLLLDNCEQVLKTVASLVAQLLVTCPALQVLATSRAPLAIAGESVAGAAADPGGRDARCSGAPPHVA